MWKLKVVDGKVVLDDKGHPVYVNSETGKEQSYDVDQMVGKITELGHEARDHRIAAKTANEKLAEYAGLEPAAVKDAITKAQALKDKKLYESGDVETLKNDLNGVWQAKFDAEKARGDKLDGDLRTAVIGGSFKGSKFIADKLLLPADVTQAMFGKNFDIVDGKIVAKDANGKEILSHKAPGNVADFDEALEILVGGYAHKDRILKSDANPGSGNRGNGGGGGNSKQITRAQYQAMPPNEAAQHFASGGTIVD